MTSLGRHTRPACQPGSRFVFFIKSQKWFFTLQQCVFLDFWDARGLGLVLSVCACAVGLRGNVLIGMRGTWGVVWRSAHVSTIPFTWLRRAKALGPTAHASNHHATIGVFLWMRVFFIPWGHVNFHAQIWALWRQFGHLTYMLDSDWSRKFVLRSDWSGPKEATFTTVSSSACTTYYQLWPWSSCCQCFCCGCMDARYDRLHGTGAVGAITTRSFPVRSLWSQIWASKTCLWLATEFCCDVPLTVRLRGNSPDSLRWCSASVK